MVKSKLDPSIDYNETKSLDITDKDFDASIYESELFNIDIIIALGKPKYTYNEKNVIFIPVYLISNDKVVLQLGIYEIMSESLPNIIDEDGDIDIDLLSPPLLY